MKFIIGRKRGGGGEDNIILELLHVFTKYLIQFLSFKSSFSEEKKLRINILIQINPKVYLQIGGTA